MLVLENCKKSQKKVLQKVSHVNKVRFAVTGSHGFFRPIKARGISRCDNVAMAESHRPVSRYKQNIVADPTQLVQNINGKRPDYAERQRQMDGKKKIGIGPLIIARNDRI